MRLLIISTFFPPLNSIASLRPYSWAKEWSRMGLDVTVLTTKKNESSPTDLTVPPPSYELIEVEGFNTTLKSKIGDNLAHSMNKPSLKKRFLNFIRNRYGIFNACRMPDLTDLWILPALRAVKNRQPWDLIISTAGPYSVHILGYLLKKKSKGNYWIADYRDTWSDNYIYPGLFPFNQIERILEKTLLKCANMITTVSDPFKKIFQDKYPTSSVFTIHNGFDSDDFKTIVPEFSFRDRSKVRFVHTGSLYLKYRDPAPLFQAMNHLSVERPDLMDRLEVIFVGMHQANLNVLIDRYQVSQWVVIQEFVSHSHALAMQRDAHYLLFFPWNDPKIDGVLTGKIFEYLCSNTPILAIGCPFIEASQQLILDLKGGYIMQSTEEIRCFLTEKLADLCKEPSQVDRTKLETYNRKHLTKEFYNRINQELFNGSL